MEFVFPKMLSTILLSHVHKLCDVCTCETVLVTWHKFILLYQEHSNLELCLLLIITLFKNNFWILALYSRSTTLLIRYKGNHAKFLVSWFYGLILIPAWNARLEKLPRRTKDKSYIIANSKRVYKLNAMLRMNFLLLSLGKYTVL